MFIAALFTIAKTWKQSKCLPTEGWIKKILSIYGEGNGNPLQYSCLGNYTTEEPGKLQFMGSQRVRHS